MVQERGLQGECHVLCEAASVLKCPGRFNRGDDDLELVEALAQNPDSGQRRARRRDGQCDLAKKIALNQGHGRYEIARLQAAAMRRI